MNANRFHEIVEALRLLSSIPETEKLLPRVVELSADLTGAARAALVLDKCAGWAERLPQITGVIETKELEWIRAIDRDLSFSTNEDKTMGVVPLAAGDEIEGYLFVSSRGSKHPLHEDCSSILSLLSLHLNNLIERNYSRWRLNQQNENRRDFISLVTHQLRLPMTSIGGYADLLASGATGPLQDRQLEFMVRIKRNIERMNQLLAALSEMNQIETRVRKFNKQAIDLNSCISAATSSLQGEFELRQQQVRVDIPADLPLAYADVRAIRQVLDALLANATRYTPDGGFINIRGYVVESMLEVAIIDNGIGISKKDQEKVFTPFFRADDPAVREHVGWGIELALAKMIVEAQDGSLSLNSVPGEGTSFTLALPKAV